MLVNEFLEIIERLAPRSLAASWDNVGLQVGSRSTTADAVLLALNLTDEVISEAISHGCGIVLVHHPLIFTPLVSASEDSATGRLIGRAARDGIVVVAAHTNLDAARGGLADILAELIDLSGSRPLVSAVTGLSKLVAFVPPSDLEQVREAVFSAGAGVIGDYEHCSWSVPGEGTFLPLPSADRAVGEVGWQETVAEHRLEMVFPTGREVQVVAALTESHSYEEPAYDIYPLQTIGRGVGMGRVGDLAAETPLADLAGFCAELFGLDAARYCGDPGRPVRRVALVPGSGADAMAIARGDQADVLITGDIKYHEALTADTMGLALIDIPHDASESLALQSWFPRLAQALSGSDVKVLMSESGTDPWRRAPRREKINISQEEQMGMCHLYVDGGSRGNPGPAGIGAVLRDAAGETLEELASYIGDATNNVAEYQALIAGLEMSLDRGVRQLSVFSDSELIVRQVSGRYKVKNEGLRPYYLQAKSLLARLEEFELNSIPRESNAHADRLVNQALDDAGY
ncbi:MAG: Nif3-like dinuclear metal center hexameric protein [Thermoleophilia bacterium]